MSKKNSIKGSSKKSSQSTRTHKNKVKKYKKLLENSPNSKHKEEWKRKLDYSMNR